MEAEHSERQQVKKMDTERLYPLIEYLSATLDEINQIVEEEKVIPVEEIKKYTEILNIIHQEIKAIVEYVDRAIEYFIKKDLNHVLHNINNKIKEEVIPAENIEERIKVICDEVKGTLQVITDEAKEIIKAITEEQAKYKTEEHKVLDQIAQYLKISVFKINRSTEQASPKERTSYINMCASIIGALFNLGNVIRKGTRDNTDAKKNEVLNTIKNYIEGTIYNINRKIEKVNPEERYRLHHIVKGLSESVKVMQQEIIKDEVLFKNK